MNVRYDCPVETCGTRAYLEPGGTLLRCPQHDEVYVEETGSEAFVPEHDGTEPGAVVGASYYESMNTADPDPVIDRSLPADRTASGKEALASTQKSSSADSSSTSKSASSTASAKSGKSA